MSNERSEAAGPIVLYDGECGFCNASVQFILRHETDPVLRFAPLQGSTAKELFPLSNLPAGTGQRTIILYDNNTFYIRSRAVRRILGLMGGKWARLSQVFNVIPPVLGDTGYRFVALIRKRLPGATSCALLPPEQQARFLP